MQLLLYNSAAYLDQAIMEKTNHLKVITTEYNNQKYNGFPCYDQTDKVFKMEFLASC
jgi:hypothetical protein